MDKTRRCAECGRILTRHEEELLARDIDFIDHYGHTIRVLWSDYA